MAVKKKKKRRQPTVVEDLFRIIFAITIMIVAVLVAFMVFKQVVQSNRDDNNAAETMITTETELTTAVPSSEAEKAEASGFVKEGGRTTYTKEDGTQAENEWIEDGGKLYYFNSDQEMQTTNLLINGQAVTFAADGSVQSIRRDGTYKQEDENEAYSLVQSNTLRAFLDKNDTTGSYYAIKYRKAAEDTEYYLGGEENKQYATPYMMQISDNYIYYLAVGTGTESSGVLYRMVPGAQDKEAFGTNVTGFVALSDKTVWYCDGGRMMRSQQGLKQVLNPMQYTESTTAAAVETPKTTSSAKKETKSSSSSTKKKETEATKKETKPVVNPTQATKAAVPETPAVEAPVVETTAAAEKPVLTPAETAAADPAISDVPVIAGGGNGPQ